MLRDIMLKATLTAVLWGIALSANAFAESPQSIDVPPGELAEALKTLAKQADVELMFRGDEVKGIRTQGVRGTLLPSEAVSILLKGTSLSVHVDAGGAMLIGKHRGGAGSAEPQAFASKEGTESNSFWDRFRVAQADQGQTSSSGPVESQGRRTETPENTLQEVVVTAQKRVERLLDVPVPVTAISGAALAESNQLRLQDYYTSVPGFSVAPATTQSVTYLAIRGITTGGQNPTVGITIDDVPYGSSAQGTVAVPDIDPSDLARVEVLRGPQGTLYGASSMGGLLKFVTVDPSVDGLDGRVQAGATGVKNGSDFGYNVRGSINVPLADTLALRASAFTRQDPGYIENVMSGVDGVNRQRVTGGRLSTLWQPSDAISVKLGALYQEDRAYGSNDVNLGLGDLQQSFLRDVGGYRRKVQAYSATIKAKYGAGELTAITGYNINAMADSWDYSSVVGGLLSANLGVSGAPIFDDIRTGKFAQEIRFSVPLGRSVEWLLGGFYTHENTNVRQDLLAVDPQTLAVAANAFHFAAPSTFTEYAAFSNLTLHLTNKFEVEVGGRESRIAQTSSSTSGGLFAGADVPGLHSSANALTYLVAPQYKMASDLMLYARMASGYRPGGANANPGSGTPPLYRPDKTYNYELGIKGLFLDRKLSVDMSVYYIDWKGIQVNSINPKTFLGYVDNGSRAKSQGVEFAVESRPLKGVTVAGWIAYDDAVLTAAFPPQSTVTGNPGDRLPYSSRVSGNFSVGDEFPIWGEVTGSAGATVSYVGDRRDIFTASPVRRDLPAYAKTDLHVGLKGDSWTINVFVTNLADRRGALLYSVLPGNIVYIQPRLAGLSLSKRF